MDDADKIVRAIADHQDKTERQWHVSYIHMNEIYVIVILCQQNLIHLGS